ncbi:MAG: RNA-binding protein [SAR324 cluster bacterium]|nr:RNA-binding protein [SAR324 cluster bacterium]
MNIYVGNLSYDTTDDSMKAAFEQFGGVDSARVIMDRMSGRPRGFGFVEMPDSGEAQTAIDGMNGSQLDGRALNVNEAKPREDRGNRGGGGGGPHRRGVFVPVPVPADPRVGRATQAGSAHRVNRIRDPERKGESDPGGHGRPIAHPDHRLWPGAAVHPGEGKAQTLQAAAGAGRFALCVPPPLVDHRLFQPYGGAGSKRRTALLPEAPARDHAGYRARAAIPDALTRRRAVTRTSGHGRRPAELPRSTAKPLDERIS